MQVIVHAGVWQAASTLTQGPRLLPSGNPSLPTPQGRLRYLQLVDGIRENVEYHPGIFPGLGLESEHITPLTIHSLKNSVPQQACQERDWSGNNSLAVCEQWALIFFAKGGHQCVVLHRRRPQSRRLKNFPRLYQ